MSELTGGTQNAGAAKKPPAVHVKILQCRPSVAAVPQLARVKFRKQPLRSGQAIGIDENALHFVPVDSSATCIAIASTQPSPSLSQKPHESTGKANEAFCLLCRTDGA